ncbi:MAG: carotenoid oxygenase [Roseibacillus sp.]|nr:carotenoid oxygenase [Roseibacillus sp.]HAO96991.1 carotenoid oxygenase [Verrucomicrobiales bacterium]
MKISTRTFPCVSRTQPCKRRFILRRCLVFDFDGTIADTLGEGLIIYNELAEKNGYNLINPDQLDNLRELDTNGLLKHLGVPKRKLPFHLATAMRRLRSRIEKLSLIEGVQDVLPLLRERSEQMGILSSNIPENIENFLEVHGIRDEFSFVSSIGKLSGKARHLRSIARTFSLAPGEIIYVGDEIRDLRAARKAKVEVIAVTWGLNSRRSLSRENPTFLIDQPSELLDIV